MHPLRLLSFCAASIFLVSCGGGGVAVITALQHLLLDQVRPQVHRLVLLPVLLRLPVHLQQVALRQVVQALVLLPRFALI